jgi:hypothetical protein
VSDSFDLQRFVDAQLLPWPNARTLVHLFGRQAILEIPVSFERR